MPYLSTNFGLLEPESSDYETSRVAVLPVPFERTVSYGKGTSAGPAAIIRASQSMELYDEELGAEPYLMGIATLPPFLPEAYDMAEAMAELQEEARTHLEKGKFLVTLGGEHSITQAPVRATKEVYGEIGVVQFDAHADLREEFEGTPYSHASVMKRVVDDGIPTLAVGIRSLSTPESQLIRERKLPVIWGHDLDRAEELFPKLLAGLPEKVYLTFDIDFFDPSLVPATGTPEPGGGLWYPTLRLLRHLFREKKVVAMDVLELAPVGGLPASDFLTSKLIYKCLGYLQEAERK
ncbi:MAG TPA: agmatinase [Thermoanaerobaculia bacterium]|jgi:agmatinase|nr:agmatinase [Thermoanaerobaculia bacterium]